MIDSNQDEAVKLSDATANLRHALEYWNREAAVWLSGGGRGKTSWVLRCLETSRRAVAEYSAISTLPPANLNAPDKQEALAGEGVEATKLEWRCFHCGDVFTSERCARLHFGRDEGATAACIIKGADGGLLRALRDAEEQADEAIQAIHAESTDAAKAYHRQRCRHTQALIAAEESGYEKGLVDGRTLPSNEALAGDDRNGVEVVSRLTELARKMQERYAVEPLATFGLPDIDVVLDAAVALATLSRTPSSPQAVVADVERVADDLRSRGGEEVEVTDDMLNAGQERLCQVRSITNFDDEAQAEIFKAMYAALTKPAALPKEGEEAAYRRGIHDAALALDARGHDNLAATVRSLLHRPDFLSSLPVRSGEDVERLRACVEKCRDTFDSYAEMHGKKLPAAEAYDPHSVGGILAKVKRNADLAEMCRAALAPPPQAQVE